MPRLTRRLFIENEQRRRRLLRLVVALGLAFFFMAGYAIGYGIAVLAVTSSIGNMLSKTFQYSHIDANLNSTELVNEMNKTLVPSYKQVFQTIYSIQNEILTYPKG